VGGSLTAARPSGAVARAHDGKGADRRPDRTTEDRPVAQRRDKRAKRRAYRGDKASSAEGMHRDEPAEPVLE